MGSGLSTLNGAWGEQLACNKRENLSHELFLFPVYRLRHLVLPTRSSSRTQSQPVAHNSPCMHPPHPGLTTKLTRPLGRAASFTANPSAGEEEKKGASAAVSQPPDVPPGRAGRERPEKRKSTRRSWVCCCWNADCVSLRPAIDRHTRTRKKRLPVAAVPLSLPPLITPWATLVVELAPG